MRNWQNILRYIHPFTDFPLLLTFFGGIIGFFLLSQLPYKLISLSIAFLSCIGLFLFIAQRIKDTPVFSPPRGLIYTPESIERIKEGVTRVTYHQIHHSQPQQEEGNSAAAQLKQNGNENENQQQELPRGEEEGFRVVRTFSSESQRTDQEDSRGSPAEKQRIPHISVEDFQGERQEQQEEESGYGHIRKWIDISPKDFLIDLEQDVTEPHEEFSVLLNQVLKAIHNIIDARAVYFFWIADDRKEARLEAMYSLQRLPIKNKKFHYGNDVLAQIIEERKPQMITNIRASSELELLPYLEQPCQTASVVIFPILYKNMSVAILAADATTSTAFDTRTINLMAQFARIITTFVHGYISKYDFYQTTKIAKTVQKILTSSIPAQDRNWEQSFKEIENFCVQVFPNFPFFIAELQGDTIQIRTTSESFSEGWKSHLYTLLPELFTLPNLTQQKIITKSIRSETIAIQTIAAIPFQSENTDIAIFGLVIPRDYPIAVQDRELLELFLTVLWYHLNEPRRITTRDLLVTHDTDLFLWQKDDFLQLLTLEIQRCHALKNSSSLMSIKIDHFEALLKQLTVIQLRKIWNHLLRTIARNVPSYTYAGLWEEYELYLLLPGIRIAKARSIAEIIREQILQTPIQHQNYQFSVTISAAIVELKPSATAVELLERTRAALQKASEKSNTVKIHA